LGEAEGGGATALPDDDIAAEAVARALFDAEEAASYAADLDARAEEQDVLDTACTATRLMCELREELRVEGSSAGGTEEDYVHLNDIDLDNDDLAYLELQTDEEAAESAAEQRALLASFEMQHHDEAIQRLMAAERRAAVHQSARQSAYLCNLAATNELRAVAARRRPEEDRARVEAKRRLQYERARAAELARVREHQYHCSPTSPMPASQKMPNAAGSSYGKHASAVAWRHATLVAPADPTPSSSR
jgi:hypothetical protein